MSGYGNGGEWPSRNGRESRWGRPSEKRDSSRSRNRLGIFTIGNSENEREEASRMQPQIAMPRPGRESKQAYLATLAQKQQERTKKATARRAMGSIKSGMASSLLGNQEEPAGYFRGRRVESEPSASSSSSFNPLGLQFGAPSSKNSNWKSTYTLPAPTFSLAAVEEARKKKEQEKKDVEESTGSVNNSLLHAFGKLEKPGSSTRKASRKSARKTARKSARKTARKSTRKSTRKSARKSTRKSKKTRK